MHAGAYTTYAPVFYDEFVYHILPNEQIVGILNNTSPTVYKACTVTLSAWAPHCRSFTSVQHAELDGGFVRYYSHLSTQSIYLANDLPFGYSSYSRVTTHLGDLIHVHCYQQRFRSQISRRRRRFTACMSGTYYNYVIIKSHCRKSLYFFCKDSQIRVGFRHLYFSFCI